MINKQLSPTLTSDADLFFFDKASAINFSAINVSEDAYRKTNNVYLEGHSHIVQTIYTIPNQTVNASGTSQVYIDTSLPYVTTSDVNITGFDYLPQGLLLQHNINGDSLELQLLNTTASPISFTTTQFLITLVY